MADVREKIYNFLYDDFIGPIAGPEGETSGDIISGDEPTFRYISGVLFPQLPHAEENDSVNTEEEENAAGDEGSPEAVDTDVSDQDDWLSLSNAVMPSAISLSVALRENDQFRVHIEAATYTEGGKKDDKTPLFNRKPFSKESEDILGGPVNADFIHKHSGVYFSVTQGSDGKGLKLAFFDRGPLKDGDVSLSLVTVSLINDNLISSGRDARHPDYQQCFFETRFSLFNEGGFVPIPKRRTLSMDEDVENNDMLYRNNKQFAAGHGCSPLWEEAKTDGLVTTISTSFLPHYVIPSTSFASFNDIAFDMLSMSEEKNDLASFSILKELLNRYEKWIEELKKQTVVRRDYPAANRNIEACESCLKRMRGGLALLQQNSDAMKAFRLMNEAMLTQQLHYKLPLREWDSHGLLVQPEGFQMPQLNDPSTWYKPSENVYGKWRPFQIAFVLLNIASITEPDSPDRGMVDLIWFPTGGGKTEAYLGLSAFTIFWERITCKDNRYGITVLMRYTLRLLTSQQYERATALICACEMIRQRHAALLGQKPITIGLYVGSSTSPNTFFDATKAYDELRTEGKENPFVVRRCPWCGAALGPAKDDKTHRLHGYVRKPIDRKTFDFHFECDNPECSFHHHKLPLSVIDEDIYREPPTLLIGTVDKFAMLPFHHEAQSIFGFVDGVKKGNPSLIIQDELHLISGPLGSMAAIYETMIDSLCTVTVDGKTLRPKIIASTATIARAKEQCHNLFNVPKKDVRVFPPSGLSAESSFFSETHKDSKGREYVGVFAPGSPSIATTAIRLYSALLEAPVYVSFDSEGQKDAYWTNVGYYNSLRELGKAVTWVHQDITEHNVVIAKRYNDDKDQRSDIQDEELTSRIPGEEIPDNLKALERALPDPATVDICLATSMISVGLDVQRLALMTVAGQPKTTSEYIQATSRVGRNSSKPGLIFVLYNPFKPRDKSLFESFQYYHSQYYAFVEPTSVSVFSPQIRAQALTAVLFGSALLHATNDEAQTPMKLHSSKHVEEAKDFILARVKDIDQEEYEATKKQLENIVEEWQRQSPTIFAYSFNASNDYSNVGIYSQIPLFYPKGSIVSDDWALHSNAIASSMRDVDFECCVRITPVSRGD